MLVSYSEILYSHSTAFGGEDIDDILVNDLKKQIHWHQSNDGGFDETPHNQWLRREVSKARRLLDYQETITVTMEDDAKVWNPFLTSYSLLDSIDSES
jgi:hypothetical protein